MHNRCTANVCRPRVRHRPCSFSVIALPRPGKRHLPDPGRLQGESGRDQARAVPRPENWPRGRFRPCGIARPSLRPTHRLHRWQPRVLTCCRLSPAAPASQRAPRAEPAPSLSSLVDPSGRWSAAPSRSQSDPLSVLSSAPECLGSAFNRPLVSRGL